MPLSFRIFGRPRSTRIYTPERVLRMKREILADVVNGTVPAKVKSFSELHDYVDANCYGGLCDERVLGMRPTDGAHGWVVQVNRLQDDIDRWIKAGGVRNARIQ